jgi:hypothetical protein
MFTMTALICTDLDILHMIKYFQTQNFGTRGQFFKEAYVGAQVGTKFVPRRQLSWPPPLARREVFCRCEKHFIKLLYQTEFYLLIFY